MASDDIHDIHIERVGGGYVLTCALRLPRRREEIFPFFADAFNLERLTPPLLRFEVLTPRPIPMRSGQRIDYRLRLHGIPLRWRTEISVWEPPSRFVDTQLRGPYRWWRHEHRFVEEGDTTLAMDRVEYGMWCDRLVHPLLVAPDLRRVFTYRREQLLRQFGCDAPSTFEAYADELPSNA